jgi:Tol biopolymer transport system component
VALAALALGPATASADTCTGLNGKLAAVIGGGSPYGEQIALVGPSEGTVQPLFTPRPGSSFEDPSFSCDGKRLAYHGNVGGSSFIEVADPRSAEKFFPAPFQMGGLEPTNPTYLSNGKMVFTSPGAQGSALPGTYVVNRDGSGLRRLFPARTAAVSTDGRWFIAGEEGQHLTVRNEKGGKLPWSKLSLAGAQNPSFSADGGRVVFQRRNDLYMVDTDGSGLRRLTHDGRSGNPVFSPDGQWVAFTRGPRGPSSAHYGEIVVLSVGSFHRVRVVARLPQGESVGDLAWSVR